MKTNQRFPYLLWGLVTPVLACLMSIILPDLGSESDLSIILKFEGKNKIAYSNQSFRFSLSDTSSKFRGNITWFFSDSVRILADTSRIKNNFSFYGKGELKRKLKPSFSDSITQDSGIVVYEQSGKYLISARINSSFDDPIWIHKEIEIIESKTNNASDSIIRIHGPTKGFVNEELVFTAYNTGNISWRWKMRWLYDKRPNSPLLNLRNISGRTNKRLPNLENAKFDTSNVTDYREGHVIYKYEKPGVYVINLETNLTQSNTEYGWNAIHVIEIYDTWRAEEEIEKGDPLAQKANKIKEYLQRIADSPASNSTEYKTYRKKLEDEYLCCIKGKTPVVVNGDRYHDLDRYCQGIHFLGNKRDGNTVIDDVKIEIKVNPNTKSPDPTISKNPLCDTCVVKLIVTQGYLDQRHESEQ